MDELKAALEALIDARLEEHGLLEAPGAAVATPAKKGGKAGKAGKKPAAIGIDDLRIKLVEVANQKGKQVAKKLIKKYKAEKLGDVDEKHWLALANDADAALVEEEEASEEDELFE